MIGATPVPYDTHAPNLDQVKIVFVQNFPPNHDHNIVRNRLLHLDSGGLPGAVCWKAQFNLLILIDMAVMFGVDRKAAKLLVMISTAVMNRTVCDGSLRWHSSTETRPSSDLSVVVTAKCFYNICWFLRCHEASAPTGDILLIRAQ